MSETAQHSKEHERQHTCVSLTAPQPHRIDDDGLGWMPVYAGDCGPGEDSKFLMNSKHVYALLQKGTLSSSKAICFINTFK